MQYLSINPTQSGGDRKIFILVIINSSVDKKILEQIGLSKNEIKVYFALLELDQSSATPIVKKSGIPNSKIYPILEKLIKKGLVSYVVKNNVRYFQASDPKNLIDLLSKREKEINSQKKEIGKLIPEIELKRKLAKDKQEATVYEGFEGVRVAVDNILNIMKRNEEYYVFALGEELKTEKLRRFFKRYHALRVKKSVKVKLIANPNVRRSFSKYYKYKGTKLRFTKLNLPTGIFVFNGYVMTVVWGEEPTAFVIKSKKNYEKYKEFFEEMWRIAKK